MQDSIIWCVNPKTTEVIIEHCRIWNEIRTWLDKNSINGFNFNTYRSNDDMISGTETVIVRFINDADATMFNLRWG